jgi:NAD(P)H dehydrogenase (quinone)
MEQSKKILVINGHPKTDSFNACLAETYIKKALEAGALVKEIKIHQLNFNPNLSHGYKSISVLETDLVETQQMIEWADHLVWVHPVWWGGLPAILKGFIDRVFLPGFAFKYRPNSIWWDKLLSGKTAHIISTLDQPYWYYWLINGRPAINQLKKMTLEFCGIKPVKITVLGPIKQSSDRQRKKWISRIEKCALNAATNR